MSERLSIPPTWALPTAFTERLGAKAGRQRLMEADGQILLILHEVPGIDSGNRKAILFWRTSSGEWLTTGKGSGLPALRKHILSFEEAVDRLEEAMMKAKSPKDYYAVLKQAVPLARAAAHLHNVMQKCRDLSGASKEIISLRDNAYEVERAASLVRDDARDGLDFEIACQSKEQAENSEQISKSTNRLNMLAAFFLPITAIASIMGVNLKTGFEQSESTLPFITMLIAGFLLGAILTALIFNNSKER